MIPKLLVLLLFSLIRSISNFDYDDVKLDDIYESRSRILMVDGNVWLHAGRDKNITFKTNGAGSIYVGDTDVARLPDTAAFEEHVLRLAGLEQNQKNLLLKSDSQVYAVRLLANVVRNTHSLVRNMTTQLNVLKLWKKTKTERDTSRRGLLVRMTRQLLKVNKIIAMNACETNKCENGGTCIPRIGTKFFCLCPPHFTGDKCELEVDECLEYDGTHAGCQNNGTCVNMRGGFQCTCPTGFHGPLCQYEMSSCSRTFELCGPHGQCIDIDAQGSKTKYKCICDWGFKLSTDLNNPTCVDVNECDSNPCHPGVDCINLPGTFQCSGCPLGYKSEGSSCVDINECTADISPCDSLVKCINTVGSYVCEPCPPGYSGDGKSCVKEDACANNNCHSLAKCKEVEESMIVGGYACFCPDGYMGDGLGMNGCLKSNTSSCLNHKCVNGGKCKPLNSEDYLCDCDENYIGKYCDKPSPCGINNPCQNDATCLVVGSNAHCKCSPGFYGNECEFQEDEECGRHFSETTGNYTFTQNISSSSKMCDFVFDINVPSSALKLQFTFFDSFTAQGDGPTDCATTLANLTLYDGLNDNSHRFATFCGERNSVHAPLLNEPITMTSSAAMLRFRGKQGTFTLSWETIERKCGYRTSKPDGMLSIPQNKQDIVCEWFISAPSQKVIELEIPVIVMHSKEEENCEKNELEVFDGYSSYDLHRISQICSSTESPQTVRSTGPFLSVSFISNMLSSSSDLETIRGFVLNYKFVDPDRKCGGDIVNTNRDFDFSGTIESPNYGSLYPPNMDCTWRFDASTVENKTDSLVVKLTFDEFDVPSSFVNTGLFPLRRFSLRRGNPFRNSYGDPVSRVFYSRFMSREKCAEDYLRIYDNAAVLQFDACNTHRPPSQLTIPDSNLVMQFHSNGAVQGKGFKVQYELVCQKSFRDNGTIQTWNFPDGGKAGKCVYSILAPRTHAISINFKTIGLRVLKMTECFYIVNQESDLQNYVQLEGGRSDNIIFNRKYFCAKYPFVEENWITVSAVRPLKIIVNSDGNTDFKGLSLEYKTIDVGCGGVISSSTGTIQSPNYPEKYQPHMHCIYDIYVSWSKAIKLTFEVFDLEVTTAANCDYDRVEVYTSYQNETIHGDLLGKFCGSMLPPVIYSKTNTISVVFVSDRSVSGQGFSAKFESVILSETCDKTFTSPSGEIVFNATDTRFDKCLFHIAVREDEKILLKMNNMSIPCDKSKLQIRNGPSEQSPGFTALYGESEVCNGRQMPALRSFSGRVLLIFTSTDSRNTFFNISYEVVANGCGGRIDGFSGSVSAPQYPLSDRRNLKCDWTIAVALGNKVRFTVAAIDDLSSADENGFCPDFSANRLDILDSAKEGSQVLKRYCKKELASEPINSDDNEIVIRYIQSGGFRSGKIYGFMGHFTTVCQGIVHTAISGSIQSPGYPHNVYGNQFCQWTIQVPKGNKIMVTVHHFVVQKQYSYLTVCDKSFLKIDDTDLGEAEVKVGNMVNMTNSIHKYCDKAIPVTIKSRHNVMHLTYNSERMPTNQFWLSWATIGCSADIRSPQEIRINKEMIDSEMDEFECQYKIQAPLGKKISIKIDLLSIFKTSTDCVYSPNEKFYGIAIFMGSSNASGAAQLTFCDFVAGKTYLSHTDEMFMYVSLKKEHVHDKFFDAIVDFVDTNATDPADACGGIVDLKPGQEASILSPGYPAAYPIGVACRWLFRAPDGYHLNYTLNEFHSPNYHAQREKTSRWSYFGTDNITCKSSLPFSDGMLTIYYTNSSTTGRIINKYCDETSDPQYLEVFSEESLVTFVGATNLYGRKSGEDHKQKNGFKLTAKPACGGVVYAESETQTISMYHQGEESCTVLVEKKDSSDSEVFIRIESYSKINESHTASYSDRIIITLDGSSSYTERLNLEDTSMSEYSANDYIKITVNHASAPSQALITYSTNERDCGGVVKHHSGTLYEPLRSANKPMDCEYIVNNFDGNKASLQIVKHNLKPTPNCTGSYIEIREDSSAGKLLTRQCDPENIDTTEYTSGVLWMYFRYRLQEADEEDETSIVRPTFEVKYGRISGGETTDEFIMKPFHEKEETTRWTIDAGEDKNILIDNVVVYLPNPTSYLRICEASDIDDDLVEEYIEVKGTDFPTETLLPYRRAYIYAHYQVTDKFMFRWTAVPSDFNKTVEKPKKVYDCGGLLAATWDWNSISNPLPAGQTHGYEENLHCRWTIQRQMFTGLELEFEYLELEDEEDCPYDYVAFQLQHEEQIDDDESISKGMKHCKLSKSHQTFSFAINRFLHIHFVTDHSRHGNGFKLKYRLSCNSFEHIPASIGFEQVLTSPNYLTKIDRQLTCQWSIVLESNRKIEARLLDLDITEESPCDEKDMLILSNRISAIYKGSPHYKDSSKYCGTVDDGENVNFTTPNGRIFIKYSSSNTFKKGFKLLLKEITADCPSGILHVDENNPKRTIYSPGYPDTISHSTECNYVLAAPNGHRVMLTFDPDHFDIEEPSDTRGCQDYVEVRDGPSRQSMLIGRYCGTRPPSSIYSTANFLFVHLHTDSFHKSNRFMFTYEVATCGGTIIVHENTTSHVLSPSYPDPIPSPIKCDWSIRSPNSHMLMAKIDSLWLFYNNNCTMESVSVLDGNSTAPALIPPICNPRFAPDVWTRSSSNQISVAFASNSTVPKAGRQYCPNKKCGFDIAVKLSEHKCGGLITNEKGFITTPGYPNRLLPHVKCTWIFKAKPGKIWQFKLNFTDQNGFQKHEEFSTYHTDKPCFPDLKLHQTVENVMYSSYLGEQFCESKQVLTSKMDGVQLFYDDSPSRDLLSRIGLNPTNINFYAPFNVQYTQMPASANNEGCTYLVNSNKTFSIQAEGGHPNTVYVASRCHFSIEKPSEYGSVWIKIDNYTNPATDKTAIDCLAWDAMFEVKSKGTIPLAKVYCEAKINANTTEMVYTNDNIDIFISQPEQKAFKQRFNLTVEFQKCGGLITEPNSGEITSPNFGDGNKYLANSKCQWVLSAPEGQIVKLNIVEMNIEYDHDCALDQLIIGEGKESEINTIHKYCHISGGKDEKLLEERFKVVRSSGRHLTIVWSTNDEHEESGWKIEYEFENEQESCGFHTRGMNGTIHSLNFGVSDYNPDMECIWDIQVPLGYHIVINFDEFDIESSENCEKDSLTISQEHSSRADSPMGNYYFLFQDEEKNTPMCGIDKPKTFESESNRVRLNFTTDGKVAARGFKLHWEAVCGGLYRLNHGVITSPNYPIGYPNKQQECGYFIYPPEDEPHGVIALQIVDFNLSNLKTNYSREPCEEDYLEIIEVENQRVIHTICGGKEYPTDAFTIKGGVALKFVTSPSFFWSKDLEANKNDRGFQVTYAINKCGGDFELREGQTTTSISSPAYPLPYEHSLDCIYNISTTSDRIISAKFELLDLENIDDCSADYVELFDGPDPMANTSLGKYCGDKKRMPQTRIRSSGPNMIVHLATDATVHGGGFKIVLVATLGESSGCGGTLRATNEWKTIRSPQDENGNYPGSLQCEWRILGRPQYQLQLRLDNIDTEPLTYPPGDRPVPECIDSLAIHDGYRGTAHVLANDICTSETPPPKMLFTSRHDATVYFETDEDGTGKGFNLSYKTVERDCGGELQAESTMRSLLFKSKITEENEHKGEKTRQRCIWTIEDKTGKNPLVVNFKNFRVPSPAGDCSDAYVEISDFGALHKCHHPGCARFPEQRRKTRLCGTNVPPPHVSNTNIVMIAISSIIEPVERSTFLMEYQTLTDCNRTIDTNIYKSGLLQSPNYPNSYTENTTCTTTLVTHGKKVMLSFLKNFQLESYSGYSSECNYDYLQIIEEKAGRSSKHCGTGVPTTVLTTGGDLTTVFQSDYSTVHSGYSANYFVVVRETDDTIQFADSYDNEGVVSSIGYPGGYNRSRTEVVTIRPPTSHDCRIIFDDVNLGIDSTNCLTQDEYLLFEFRYKGTVSTARLRDCTFKDGIGESYLINGDDQDRYLKFTFKSDENSYNDGRGFKVSWSCDNYSSAGKKVSGL